MNKNITPEDIAEYVAIKYDFVNHIMSISDDGKYSVIGYYNGKHVCIRVYHIHKVNNAIVVSLTVSPHYSPNEKNISDDSEPILVKSYVLVNYEIIEQFDHPSYAYMFARNRSMTSPPMSFEELLNKYVSTELFKLCKETA